MSIFVCKGVLLADTVVCVHMCVRECVRVYVYFVFMCVFGDTGAAG